MYVRVSGAAGLERAGCVASKRARARVRVLPNLESSFSTMSERWLPENNE